VVSGEKIVCALASQGQRRSRKEKAVKKTRGSKKIALHRETVLRLQPESLELRQERVVGASSWCSGPSCDIYRYCTQVDCVTTGC
jgi:hypothetical protein